MQLFLQRYTRTFFENKSKVFNFQPIWKLTTLQQHSEVFYSVICKETFALLSLMQQFLIFFMHFVKNFFFMTSTLGSSIQHVHKIFRKTNIYYPLIRTRTCAYQRVRNVSFPENFAYVLSGSVSCYAQETYSGNTQIIPLLHYSFSKWMA